MAINIDDLRRLAMRRLPRAVFDFADGGAEDEQTLRANRADFAKLTFRPKILVDVSKRDQSTTILGQRVSSPLILAPTGLAGMLWAKGEMAAARAAARHDVIFTLSTLGACSIEDVAETSSGPLWFQLYVMKDRDVTRALVERAQRAGYKALCLTVDLPVLGQRERDLRNGATIPPKITVRNVIDVLQRPGWLRRVWLGPQITFKNFVGSSAALTNDAGTLWQYVNSLNDPGVNWNDLAWFRSLWPGPIAIKGVVTAEDARRAVSEGIEAIIVSNHGGRQLDSMPSAIEALPEIVDAVGDRAEVILDGGVRRGTDVVKALALGARAVLLGRPPLWGLSVGGADGVAAVMQHMHGEMVRAMQLCGAASLAALTPDLVKQ